MREHTHMGDVLDMRESEVEILRERVRELEAINKGLVKQLRELKKQPAKRKLAMVGR